MFVERAACLARRARRRAERAMVAGAASSLGFEGARAAQLSLGLFGGEQRELWKAQPVRAVRRGVWKVLSNSPAKQARLMASRTDARQRSINPSLPASRGMGGRAHKFLATLVTEVGGFFRNLRLQKKRVLTPHC